MRAVRAMTILVGLVFTWFGMWAFLAPASFYDLIATYPPYNRHLLHDVGAFQLAIGASLLAALVKRDALLVALFGATVGSIAHFLSHVIDRHLGGRPTDPWALGAIALVMIVALAYRFRGRPEAGD